VERAVTDDGRIAVAIVEDHPVFRQGLAGLVEDEPDLVLDVAVRSVPELDRRLRDGPPPGLLVLDLSLSSGGPQGADAVRAVCERGLRVLVVSASSDRATVVAAIAAGANGYVSKSAEPHEIVRAMHTVARGASYLSPTLAGYLLDDVQAIKLTDREADVLRLLAAGDTDLDIAEELVISVNTVHSHLDRIRAKTGMHRRVELTRYAIDRGLMPPSPLP
jgi:DNA-binding NarL/FixJ family response regulator